jgi:hypothetical protein
MTRTPAYLLAITTALALALPAVAGETTKTVQFAKGKSSATLSGSIKGDNSVNYMLNAKAGQTISIEFEPSNASCYFNFLEPGSDSASFIGSTSGNEYSGVLEASGDHTTQVYLMRNAARRNETCKYSITFEVTGGGTDAPAAAAAAPSEVAKGACLYRFGEEGSITMTSPLKPGYWELIIQASAGKRKVACTVNDDGTIADWVEMKH